MAIIPTHPQTIEGRWRKGYALDFHTTSSVPVGENAAGHMQFDTTRPEIAELLFRLKNRADAAAAPPIIAAAVDFLKPRRAYFDSIVPVASSLGRPPPSARCNPSSPLPRASAQVWACRCWTASPSPAPRRS